MLNKELKKLVEANGLKLENDVAYGMLNNCFVTLCTGTGVQRMYIYAGLAQDEDVMMNAKAAAEEIAELGADFDTYHIINDKKNLPGNLRQNGIVLKSGGLVQINFYIDKKTTECMQNFINDILPRVSALTNVNVCMKCAQDNNDTTVPVLLYGEAVVPMHRECADAYAAETDAQEKAKMPRMRGGNNFTGVIGAFLGAMIGAVVWAVVGMIGYIAGLVGWLIAFLSGKGFDLLGGKSIKVKLTMVIVFTIIAILLGNVLALGYLFHDIYVEETANLPAWQMKLNLVPTEAEFMQSVFYEYFHDAEGLGEFARNTGIGLVFAAWACIYLLRDMKNQSKPKVVVLKG